MSLADLGWDPDSRSQHTAGPLDSPYDCRRAADLLLATQGAPKHRRRTFLLLGGAAVTAPALELLLDREAAYGGPRNGGPLSEGVLQQIEGSLHDIRALDDAQGSEHALTWTDGIWRSTAEMITTTRGAAPLRARLHTAFISLCEQYGWMLFDSDRHEAAQRVYQTGLSLAREAEPGPGTADATANLLASMAYQCSHLGQHHEASTLISVAGRHQSLSPGVVAVLAERHIVIAGRGNDPDGVRRARATASEYLDRRTTDDPWWTRWISPEAVDSATGRAWLALKNPVRARDHLAGRLDIADEKYPRDRLVATLDLIDIQQLEGDVTTALTTGESVLATAKNVSSPRLHRRLSGIATTLSREHPGLATTTFAQRTAAVLA
ncbi:XRE family transcriptional regulator [Streptomyces goshikiensis]|uniref:XRE family transcriptional regulator n=1 Tax=Streptomyces goshikiensis TaxID=1942 RepID=UPI0036BDA14E